MLCSLPPELLSFVLGGCDERDHLALSHACTPLRAAVHAHVHRLQGKRLHALLQASVIRYKNLSDTFVMKLHLEHVMKANVCLKYKCGVCCCAVGDVACCVRCPIPLFPWRSASIGPVIAATGLLLCAYRRHVSKAY
jgi:hypothetical protein